MRDSRPGTTVRPNASAFRRGSSHLSRRGGAGVWTLSAESSGAATVAAAADGAAAEISVGIAELTSLWSGAVSAAQLHSWGMLEAADEKALAKADYMLATGKQPWCCDGW